MADPKPCPACGGETCVERFTEDTFYVYCLRCWMSGPKRTDPSEAVQEWNDIPTQYDE